MILTCVLFLVALLYFLHSRRWLSTNKNVIPGPWWRLPVLGHMLQVGDKPHETLLNWKEKYGPIIFVQLGSFPTVFLNDANLIREALNKNEFSGRPAFKFFADCNGGVTKGVIFTDGENWSELRRFLIKSLRNFGLGKSSMESVICREAIDLVERMKDKVGQTVCLKDAFSPAVVNSIWGIITGQRFNQDDPEIENMIKLFNAMLQEDVKAQGVAMLIPWIAEWFPSLCGYEKMLHPVKEIQSFMRKQIKKAEETYKEGEQRGFVDAFIHKMRNTKDTKSPFHSGNDELVHMLEDIFGAAMDTTSTLLYWAVLLLAKHQDVQVKVQLEIDTVVGRNGNPSLQAREEMHYTLAVMQEVQRFGSVAALGVYHRALVDTHIGGYFIPKDTVVIPNLYAVHYDKTLWKDPENFRPERFLNEEGMFVKNDNCMPFSVGKRACPGEAFAKDSFFLFLTHFLREFSLKAESKIDTTGGDGLVRSPKPHNFVLTLR